MNTGRMVYVDAIENVTRLCRLARKGPVESDVEAKLSGQAFWASRAWVPVSLH